MCGKVGRSGLEGGKKKANNPKNLNGGPLAGLEPPPEVSNSSL
jgi:hypothetical protein